MRLFASIVISLATWTALVSCGQVNFKNGAFVASWSRKGDKMEFKVEAQATGWISFGFALQAPTGMMGYDVMVGGVMNGKGYIGVSKFPIFSFFIISCLQYLNHDLLWRLMCLDTVCHFAA